MTKEKFFQNKFALITVLSACGVVAVSMGLRQTFGLFSDFFVKDLQSTITEFGLAIGIQMLMWGNVCSHFWGPSGQNRWK